MTLKENITRKLSISLYFIILSSFLYMRNHNNFENIIDQPAWHLKSILF